MMKVLVAGGAGYIGSVTTEQLLERGDEVIVFDNLERGHRRAVDPRARLLEGDLRDAERIRAALRETRPDAVLHFAAYALVGESMEKPEMYFDNNVKGGVNLLDAMIRADTPKIVFSSTCATYGQPERVPITEDESQTPANPYGESKLMFERMLDWTRRLRGMQTVALRYFNACGATRRYGEDHEPESHLIPLALQVALGRREKLTIFGDDYDTPDGTCLRDYIHIVDLAQAHILALQTDVSGAFNLGNGNGYSVREVIEAARAATGHEIPAVVGPRRPGDPARLVAAADKARATLGWQPQFPALRDMVESAWAWHRAHPRGYEA
jgi:UDP-glucose 4-epimerase